MLEGIPAESVGLVVRAIAGPGAVCRLVEALAPRLAATRHLGFYLAFALEVLGRLKCLVLLPRFKRKIALLLPSAYFLRTLHSRPPPFIRHPSTPPISPNRCCRRTARC